MGFLSRSNCGISYSCFCQNQTGAENKKTLDFAVVGRIR